MTMADWIGFIGVFQILLAFLLNVTGKLSHQHLAYILLNLVGAAMACLSSILIWYWPFIILEGVWSFASLVALIQVLKKESL